MVALHVAPLSGYRPEPCNDHPDPEPIANHDDHKLTWITKAVIVALLTNAAIMVWEIFDHSEIAEEIDLAILWFFVLELGLRIKGAGRSFLRDRWLMFDILIITLALLPLGANLASLRIMRAARLTHMSRHLPHLKHITLARWIGLAGRRISSINRFNN